jgi:hypothetical protein
MRGEKKSIGVSRFNDCAGRQESALNSPLPVDRFK